MIRICFVCLGNICRSPMAEYMMKEFVRREGKSKEFIIESRGTSYEEQGNDLYLPAQKKLREENIPFERHFAKRLEKSDYEKFDVFYCMEDKNIKSALAIMEDPLGKLKKLLDRDIADPWYTGDFDKTYQDLEEGLLAIMKKASN
ncbi:MAG: low molecular weight phosphotyrosine protein phosphatase [Bacilli bacterium]|nr:low molecular weight phosphotyrosine protein phosphatase [Bacilli bacterium]